MGNFVGLCIHVPEMEPGSGSRVTGHRVTGSAILAGSGRVTGQCVKPVVFTRFLVFFCCVATSMSVVRSKNANMS